MVPNIQPGAPGALSHGENAEEDSGYTLIKSRVDRIDEDLTTILGRLEVLAPVVKDSIF